MLQESRWYGSTLQYTHARMQYTDVQACSTSDVHACITTDVDAAMLLFVPCTLPQTGGVSLPFLYRSTTVSLTVSRSCVCRASMSLPVTLLFFCFIYVCSLWWPRLQRCLYRASAVCDIAPRPPTHHDSQCAFPFKA